MATATFQFHGELAQFLGRDKRGSAFSHSCARAATVKHAIESLGVPHTEAGRLSVNDRAATLSRIVREGDVIEVFPHQVADAFPGEAPLFIADAHLGGLARLLRMLGIDTLYQNAYTDRQILEIAGRERRVLLTRDHELLKCRDVLRGCFVHARKPEAQLREVFARYALARHARPFTLCLHCNCRLEPVARSAVAKCVPESIVARYAEFMSCPACRRVYWQGSHWERMRTMLGGELELEVRR
jgi:uncharacterized protein with PIN domain